MYGDLPVQHMQQDVSPKNEEYTSTYENAKNSPLNNTLVNTFEISACEKANTASEEQNRDSAEEFNSVNMVKPTKKIRQFGAGCKPLSMPDNVFAKVLNFGTEAHITQDCRKRE